MYWRDLPVDKERMKKFIGEKSMSIVDAMAKIDINAKGILFITDENGKLEPTWSSKVMIWGSSF